MDPISLIYESKVQSLSKRSTIVVPKDKMESFLFVLEGAKDYDRKILNTVFITQRGNDIIYYNINSRVLVIIKRAMESYNFDPSWVTIRPTDHTDNLDSEQYEKYKMQQKYGNEAGETLYDL